MVKSTTTSSLADTGSSSSALCHIFNRRQRGITWFNVSQEDPEMESGQVVANLCRDGVGRAGAREREAEEQLLEKVVDLLIELEYR